VRNSIVYCSREVWPTKKLPVLRDQGSAVVTSAAAPPIPKVRVKPRKRCPHLWARDQKKRTRPVPASILATWKGQTRPIIADVDIIAAGVVETYSFMCVVTKGSAYVRRVMS
jgi:hypothetical protein